MKSLGVIALLALALCACSGDDTSEPSPAGAGTTAAGATTDTAPPGNATGFAATFGGDAPGQAYGTSAETGTHPGATGTNPNDPMDPNVTPPNTTVGETAGVTSTTGTR